MEITMVDRLKSEICLTLDSTVGTHYFTQYRGTSPPAQATLQVAEQRYVTCHTGLEDNGSKFAPLRISFRTYKKVTTKFNDMHNICKTALKEVNSN